MLERDAFSMTEKVTHKQKHPSKKSNYFPKQTDQDVGNN